MLIRFIIAACLIGFGVFLFAMSTFGVFKFKYVLNRMHAAAIGDSLAAPVSSHMIAKMEIATITEEDAEEFKKRFDEGVDKDV